MKQLKPTSIRLPSDLYDKVKNEAFRMKRSISNQIEFILEEYYIKIENSDKNKNRNR